MISKKNPTMRINRRGQTAMLELMIGTVLVLVLLVAITSSFAATYTGGETERIVTGLSLTGENALDRLLSSGGMSIDGTSNWEKETVLTNVSDVGFAVSPYMVSAEKLSAFARFTNSDYYRLKQLMGLDAYDFSLDVVVRDCTSPCSGSFTDSPVFASQSASQNNESFAGMGRVAAQKVFTVVVQRAAVLDNGFARPATILKNKPVLIRLRVFAQGNNP